MIVPGNCPFEFDIVPVLPVPRKFGVENSRKNQLPNQGFRSAKPKVKEPKVVNPIVWTNRVGVGRPYLRVHSLVRGKVPLHALAHMYEENTNTATDSSVISHTVHLRVSACNEKPPPS